MDSAEMKRRAEAIREKARKELDYDDDGDIDAADFKTKKGKKALIIAGVVLLVILVAVFGN